ncbi:SHSP domain-containing protein [Trichonephila clavata]|uniref:SHSP domain-containing protein n=1 Tax=Trichonephila clavata TaxID=2740835 RepID=A0A8X6LR55_TRICU|nr:SHSP domain-containing protein [Trichonephila clavata]
MFFFNFTIWKQIHHVFRTSPASFENRLQRHRSRIQFHPEKFDQEMKLMEDEMNRFRSQLMDREVPRIQSHTAATGTDGPPRIDPNQYQPEEIVVKTVDNKLQVQAKHEEKTDTKSVYREYNREFLLPKGTNPEAIKSSLSTDGVLTVEAPIASLGRRSPYSN